MKSFCFELFRFKIVFKAFYRYIIHISEPVSSVREFRFIIEALLFKPAESFPILWITQIKVDPLQFQMIYYSYLYYFKGNYFRTLF